MDVRVEESRCRQDWCKARKDGKEKEFFRAMLSVISDEYVRVLRNAYPRTRIDEPVYIKM
jgi:hypothetical protein